MTDENYWEETQRKLNYIEIGCSFKSRILQQFLADKAEHEKEMKDIDGVNWNRIAKTQQRKIDALEEEIAELKRKIELLERDLKCCQK